MSSTERTDGEVVKESLANKEAFAELILRYAEKLDRYARRLGVQRNEDREDLLQNVFLKAYQNLNSFDQSLSFSAWIYRITHNEAVSFFRKRNVRPEGHLIEDNEAALLLLRDEEDIREKIEQTSDNEHLLRALDELEYKYKEALILRFFEERDYAEISDILEMPIGSVGTLIHRAKKTLSKKLSHLNEEYGRS